METSAAARCLEPFTQTHTHTHLLLLHPFASVIRSITVQCFHQCFSASEKHNWGLIDACDMLAISNGVTGVHLKTPFFAWLTVSYIFISNIPLSHPPSLSHGHPSDQVSLLLFTSSFCVWNTEYSRGSFPEHGEGLFSIKVNLLVSIPLEKVPSPHPWVLLWAFLLPTTLLLTQNLARGQRNSGCQILAGSWTLDLTHKTVVMGLDEKNMHTATIGHCKNWATDGWAVAQR